MATTLIKVMNFEERFAEKVSAVFTRQKGRDWYDAYFYHKIVNLNGRLVYKKIGQRPTKLPSISGKEYTKDLKPILTRFIGYETVVPAVKKYLKESLKLKS